MTIEEIKELINETDYKASFFKVNKEFIIYRSLIRNNKVKPNYHKYIYFKIPLQNIEGEMEAEVSLSNLELKWMVMKE